jgi:wyosine [tRNA(Phe)-imidazoG37] synthetase (radical SAM superfamily)
MKNSYLYGPVISRRLGNSLGVNIIPFKTCSFDCIYCECGKTINPTNERKEYLPTSEIIAELNSYLKTGPDLNYISFAGLGEPTLHIGIGQIINFLKENYPQYKVAVLTNASLFHHQQVIQDIKNSDLVIPSLNGISREAFNKVNLPFCSLKPENIIKGINNLKESSAGQVWLEIFIVPGINDTPTELDLFKEALKRINVDKVQLNTLDRPGTCSTIKPAGKEHMREIASYLGNVEIV